MMKREWNLKVKGCALLLSGLLLMTAGCTPKKDILSVQEEDPAEEQYDSSFEEEEGLYDSWIKKKDAEESEVDENEIPVDITESEATGLVLAEVMRISGEEDPDVDQTSARVIDQNSEAYLVSINLYEMSENPATDGNSSGSIVTELYRVDKRTGEVRYLTDAGDFQ